MKKKITVIVAALAVCAGMIAVMPITAHAATSKSQSQAKDWAQAQVNTKAIDWDGVYGPQCVDFIQQYYNFLGVWGGGGNACDYAWNTLPSGFTRIEDYYGFVPEPGDIAVWTRGDGGDYCGHVAVVLGANEWTMDVAEIWGSEAGNPNQIVHKRTLAYNGNGRAFWGVIRPNFNTKSTATVTSFDSVTEGTYLLYNRKTDAALCLGNNQDYNCNDVHVYDYNTTNRGQLMSIKSCSSDGKTYKIRPVDATRLVQMYGTTAIQGTNVCIYDDLANSTQWWKFKKVDGGYAIFIDCDHNYALTSQNGGAVLTEYTGAGDQIWELKAYNPTYTVSYNANGGNGYMSDSSFTSGTSSKLASNVFSRSGYKFVGWSTKANATSALYTDAASVKDLTADGGSVTLYAVWEENLIDSLSGLKVSSTTENSVTLTWDKCNGADGYTVMLGLDIIADTKNTSYTITGLSPNTTYAVSVTPYADNVFTTYGDRKNATTKATAKPASSSSSDDRFAPLIEGSEVFIADPMSAETSKPTVEATSKPADTDNTSKPTSVTQSKPADTESTSKPTSEITSKPTSTDNTSKVSAAPEASCVQISESKPESAPAESKTESESAPEPIETACGTSDDETHETSETASQSVSSDNSGESSSGNDFDKEAATKAVGTIASSSLFALLCFLKKLLGK